MKTLGKLYFIDVNTVYAADTDAYYPFGLCIILLCFMYCSSLARIGCIYSII